MMTFHGVVGAGPTRHAPPKPGRSTRPLRHGIELGLQAFLRVARRHNPKVDILPTKMQSHDGWYVQAVIPGLPPIQLGGFKTKDETKEWVRRKSQMWIDEHRRQYF
jgi:hypothetical protein